VKKPCVAEERVFAGVVEDGGGTITLKCLGDLNQSMISTIMINGE
jgi:hypothetical protein